MARSDRFSQGTKRVRTRRSQTHPGGRNGTTRYQTSPAAEIPHHERGTSSSETGRVAPFEALSVQEAPQERRTWVVPAGTRASEGGWHSPTGLDPAVQSSPTYRGV